MKKPAAGMKKPASDKKQKNVCNNCDKTIQIFRRDTLNFCEACGKVSNNIHQTIVIVLSTTFGIAIVY